MLPTCITPLPMDLTQRLSDYEFLCFVISKMNEIITHFNEIDKTIDEKIAGIRQEIINTVNSTLAQFETDMNKKFQDYKISMDNQMAQYQSNINKQLDDMRALLNQTISELNKALDDQIILVNKLLQDNNTWTKEYVYSEIFKLKQELKCDIFPVINPFTAERDSLQNVLDDLANYLRYGALTAAEYDNLFLTAGEFDAKGLTAFQYDFYAKIEFSEKCNQMFSPFTGKREQESTVIYNLAGLHQDGVTAGEFDALNLTAGEFDEKLITAYQFDWTRAII